MFSHSIDTAAEVAPCKYFAKVCFRAAARNKTAKRCTKGNCKFGQKCMLAHILPDGRRVNRSNLPLVSYQAQMLGSGFAPQYVDQIQDPGIAPQYTQRSSMVPQVGNDRHQQLQDSYYAASSNTKQYGGGIDAGFPAWPIASSESPPVESRLGQSPYMKAVSALDTTLPGSFDSQGISHFARHGPVAASVPSRFGFESTTSTSTSASPPASTKSTLAFGNLNNLALGENGRGMRRGQLATSPPPPASELFPRRIMLPERFGSTPQVISSSLGARPIVRIAPLEDDDDHFKFEEDLVPGSLQELLTPQEKMRRFSRSEEDGGLSARLSQTNLSSSSNSKVGSPVTASPSRYASVFAQRKEEGDLAALGVSAFGHVGSPLRNSSLSMETGPAVSRAVARPRSRETSFISSPPRASNLSMLLKRNSISSKSALTDGSVALPPVAQRSSSSSSIGSALGGQGALMRAISSSSIGRERISEEPFVFMMEEDDGAGDKGSSHQQDVPGGGRGAEH